MYLYIFFIYIFYLYIYIYIYTHRESNIAAENQWLKDEISFWDDLFSGVRV